MTISILPWMKVWLLTPLLWLPVRGDAQIVDPVAAREVDSLLTLSDGFTDEQDFEAALTGLASAESLALAKLGQRSRSYMDCCSTHARMLHIRGQLADAETWYLQALDIAGQVLEKDDPERFRILFNLAILYRNMGRYPEAKTLYLDARSYWERTRGKEDPHYVNCLTDLGIVYSEMGEEDNSESVYLEARNILGRTVGTEDVRYANCVDGLAGVLLDHGKYEEAEGLIRESLGIRERTVGKGHPNYASSLHMLAICFHRRGWYEKAAPLYWEANTIFREVLGEDHPFLANSLNCLAVLYKNLGEFDKAEPLLLECLDLRERTMGQTHPAYADGLVALAGLYEELGQWDRAEKLYPQAMQIYSDVLGPESEAFEEARANLAILYTRMGRYAEAEPLFLADRDRYIRSGTTDHPMFGSCQNNLADACSHLGRSEEALSLYKDALGIWRRTLGPRHPYVEFCLNNLCGLYLRMGRTEEAMATGREAMALADSVLGQFHPEYAKLLNNLAVTYATAGRNDEAAGYLRLLAKVRNTQIGTAMSFLSNRELRDFVTNTMEDLDRLLWFAYRSGDPSILPSCYDNILLTKGLLLQNEGRIRQMAEQDPVSEELLGELMGCQRQLAGQLTLPVPDQDSLLMSGLEDRANRLQKKLVRMVSGFGSVHDQTEWTEVRDALTSGMAAVEFVRFHANGPDEPDRVMYGALVVQPGWKEPVFQVLCDEGALDRLLRTDGSARVESVNALYALETRGFRSDEDGQVRLYDLLWKPLESHLAGVRTICFSPVGLMHRINLDAIPVSDSESLADRYFLVDMISTRQWVRSDPRKPPDRNALFFGGIDYKVPAEDPNDDQLLAMRSLADTPVDPSFPGTRGGSWTVLPGTDKEVDAISDMARQAGYASVVLKGKKATEEEFKSLGSGSKPSPAILHVATHGYFFPDPGSGNAPAGDQETVFRVSGHPMLRSGLILAGGNAGWLGEPGTVDKEDGVLTAYEICQLDLSGTELVVLSACETGLGDIEGDEGVFGLQRAFKMAGAHYLIMSLWQVPDKQTSLLMRTFYRKWLGDGLSIPEAFHAAQKELRESGFDPYQWAGFVLVD